MICTHRKETGWRRKQLKRRIVWIDHSLVDDDDGVDYFFACVDLDYAIYDDDDRDEEVDHEKVWT